MVFFFLLRKKAVKNLLGIEKKKEKQRFIIKLFQGFTKKIWFYTTTHKPSTYKTRNNSKGQKKF